MGSKLRRSYEQASAWIARFSVLDLVAVLSATVLLRNSHGGVYSALSVIVLIASILSHKCRRSPAFWLAIALLWSPRLIVDWYHNEDHVYFGVYWVTAFALALWGPHQEDVLERSARLLIGLAFGIAVMWKLFVPQFADGSLLHYKLLFDYRFRGMVTEPLGGLTPQQNKWNHTAGDQLNRGDLDPPQATLQFPNRVTWFAVFLTVWTVAIEALLAVLFLLPKSRWTNRWRDPTLILFLISTYLVAPVMGFASLFTTMGIAQAPRQSGAIRLAYGIALCTLTVWFSIAF